MDVYKLPVKEFKITIIKMLNKLKKMIHKTKLEFQKRGNKYKEN